MNFWMKNTANNLRQMPVTVILEPGRLRVGFGSTAAVGDLGMVVDQRLGIDLVGDPEAR